MSAVAAAVGPVFGTVLVGYGLARGGLFSREMGSLLVRFMYFLAIPALLFRSLAAADLPAAMPWSFLGAFYVPSLLLFFATMALVRWGLGWRRHEAGIGGMAAAYSNMILLGFPLTLNAFGAPGAVPMFILLATQSTLFFPLTTYTLETGDHPERKTGARSGWRRLVDLVVNPVILSLMLGVVVNLAGFGLPLILDRLLELIGAAGPACALVALGISLAGYRLRGAYRDVVILVVLKNVIHPLVVWGGCRLAGIEGLWMHVAVLLALMPCGVNAFIFSASYAVREEEVSKCIVFSTAVSSVTATVMLAFVV